MLKRTFLLLIAFCVLLGGCSFESMLQDDLLMVANNPNTENPSGGYSYQPMTELRLPVGEQERNPYRMQTDTTLSTVPLVFDSLTKMTNDYSYELCIASAVQPESYSCTVLLQEGILFSDGTSLTAADVRYSFYQAISEGSTYAAALSGVSSLSVLSDYALTFFLAEPDPNFAHLLCFPIIKNGSAAEPVGSGRYLFSDPNTLVLNPNWYGENTGTIAKVHLVQQPDRETSFYSMRVGNVDLLYSEQEKTTIETGSSISYVPSTHLLFLGMNDQNAWLSNLSFRQFLNLAIDRQQLLERYYFDQAAATRTPFPPGSDSGAPEAVNYDEMAVLLSGLGLDNRDEEGYIIVGSRRVTFTILVNTDTEGKKALADGVAELLSEYGFSCTVLALPFAQYQERVLTGSGYDFFIGEVKLRNNFDLTALLQQIPFVTDNGIYSREIYRQYKFGEISQTDYLASFAQTVPFVPLGFRHGVLYYARQLYYEIESTSQDAFYNIHRWQ